MKNKYLIILLAIAFLFMFASCGEDEETGGEDKESNENVVFERYEKAIQEAEDVQGMINDIHEGLLESFGAFVG